MNNTTLNNKLQQLLSTLSQKEIESVVSIANGYLMDSENPNDIIKTTTRIERVSNMSKYRPRRVIVHGADTNSYTDVILEDLKSTSYTLLRELHKNRDHYSNISYIDKSDKDLSHLNRDMKPWISKDLIVGIKTKQQVDEINLAAASANIGINISNNNNNLKYYMFNPQLILPYSRENKGRHFDFIYIIYKYLSTYTTPYKEELKKVRKMFRNAFLEEYFKDTSQCSFDYFLKRSKEFVELYVKGKNPELHGWFIEK